MSQRWRPVVLNDRKQQTINGLAKRSRQADLSMVRPACKRNSRFFLRFAVPITFNTASSKNVVPNMEVTETTPLLAPTTTADLNTELASNDIRRPGNPLAMSPEFQDDYAIIDSDNSAIIYSMETSNSPTESTQPSQASQTSILSRATSRIGSLFSSCLGLGHRKSHSPSLTPSEASSDTSALGDPYNYPRRHRYSNPYSLAYANPYSSPSPVFASPPPVLTKAGAVTDGSVTTHPAQSSHFHQLPADLPFPPPLPGIKVNYPWAHPSTKPVDIMQRRPGETPWKFSLRKEEYEKHVQMVVIPERRARTTQVMIEDHHLFEEMREDVRQERRVNRPRVLRRTTSDRRGLASGRKGKEVVHEKRRNMQLWNHESALEDGSGLLHLRKGAGHVSMRSFSLES